MGAPLCHPVGGVDGLARGGPLEVARAEAPTRAGLRPEHLDYQDPAPARLAGLERGEPGHLQEDGPEGGLGSCALGSCEGIWLRD